MWGPVNFMEAWHGWPCPTPGLPWLAYMLPVNRERIGSRVCLLRCQHCHLCLPLVCMAAFPVVNGVEGIAEYLPARHYSVLASCHSWCYHPAMDWCMGSLGGLSRHSTAQHNTAHHSLIQPVCVLALLFLCWDCIIVQLFPGS